MTVDLPIALTVAQAHDRACAEVNRWRGHCIELYARIERAMGDALAALPGVAKVPHNFGNRLKALETAVAADGTSPAPRIAKALADARPLLEHRNRLIHATAQITIDRRGSWFWNYSFLPSGKPEQAGYECQRSALEFEQKLQRSSRSLRDQLWKLAEEKSPRG